MAEKRESHLPQPQFAIPNVPAHLRIYLNKELGGKKLLLIA